ncbi:class I adenylate-forming enzyme family protein [Methylocystis parvus]|uniref:class I adenylate-forming enzyme family protein n=1 Tax=Methylocystis parvus TaxID=134 RepID=UPI003C725F2E
MSRPSDLRSLARAAGPQDEARLQAPSGEICWRSAIDATILGGRREELAGKSVLIGVSSQYAAALAMLELDGVAARMVITPPDFSAERLASAISQADVDVIVCDEATKDFGAETSRIFVSEPSSDPEPRCQQIATEWVLPTSGTTGAPKLVAHRLDGLLGAVRPRAVGEPAPIWGTFYDIRRYGGMQIFLRAATSGATLLLTDAEEPLANHVARMAEAGITHLSGTPSHWRRLLMSPVAAWIAPAYVRLSGEIADRAILDSLAAFYPQAKIVHAYASTEAGVGFEVTDGREGFPAAYLGGLGGVEMRIVDGSLCIKSPRTADRYVGRDDLRLADEEGFVDTDDLVERIGDRLFFKGRRAGTINVGGLKVHPEEVEQVINLHEAVRMSLVKARRNPITGDLIVAQVMLKEDEASPERKRAVRDEILQACRARLERHKAPVSIDFVPSLAMSAGGKLLRGRA